MVSKRKMIASHAALFLYIFIIFISIPYILGVTKTIGGLFGPHVFGWVVVSLTVGIYAAVFIMLRKKKEDPNADTSRSLFWVSIIAAVYLLLAGFLWKQAVETVHLMEYGLLSWLLFQALRYHIYDVSLFIRSAFIVLLIGILDEIIQWFTPGRTWGFGDIWMNFVAGILLQIGVWKVVWKEKSSTKATPPSVSAISVWLITSLLLLGLCVSNTNSRFFYFKNRHPFLSNFHVDQGMTQDFGHIFRDPEIGIFYSRFTREELAAIDAYGAGIHQQPLVLGKLASNGFQELLESYTARTFPFLLELRLHAILRDGNYDLAGKSAVGRNENFLTAAYRENQILLQYYGGTLRRSIYVWPAGRSEKIKRRINTRQPYDSPANARLITEFSEKGIWTGIIILIAAVCWLNLVYRKRYRETDDHKSY